MTEHGSSARYGGGCRCDDCKAAHASYHRAWRRRPRDIRPEHHGTQYAYANLRCRCDDCKAAHAAAISAFKHARKAAP